MPIVVQYMTNVGAEEYEEVIERLQFHDYPPDGLVVHTAAGDENGRMRVF